ncbi:MAG: DUF4411 family protein [Pyrinomonadaceae bacterium]
MTYWLDSDVFIQAKNKPYKFNRVPQFWIFLSEKLDEGEIRVAKLTYQEITTGKDQLSDWAKLRKSKGMCVSPSKEVQEKYAEICTHVASSGYHQNQIHEFLKGADGWVIAHAMVEGGTVVTQEVRDRTKTAIKIPILCKALGVRCIDTYEMLDELDFRA